MRQDFGQFTSLDDDRTNVPEAASDEDSKDMSSLESQNKGEARYKRRAMLVALGARLMQALLLLNLVVLTVLLFVDSPLQDSSKVSCSPRVIEQVLMPLNVLLGLLVLALPRCTQYNGRSRGLQHTIITPVVKVSDCDYVIPDHSSHLAENPILEEGAEVDCTDVNCEDFGGDDSPRHISGSCTPVEDLMHELMQVALSLCSAAPEECRGLLAHCSYEERQAVHLLGQMVRNHLFPEADGIEDNGGVDQPVLVHQRSPGLLSGFNVSIASDGANKSEASGTHASRWNMLNDAVDTFLFGTSSGAGAEQVSAQVPGLQLPIPDAEREPLERENMDETPESRPKTVDSDRPSAPTVTPPQEVTGPTASPTQDSASGGSAGQSPREMSDEENPDSPRSPFSVPEVSLTIADPGFDRPVVAKPVMMTRTGVNGEFQVPMLDDLEAASSSQPHATQVGRRNSNQSASSKKSGKRRMSGHSAASRHESRRSSVSSANSQFSATSFTDFNRRQSYRGSSTSGPPPAVRRVSGDSQKPSGRKGDKSKYSTNSSCKSNLQPAISKDKPDKSRFNTGSSSHPSEVVRGLLKAIAAAPSEEVGGVSWSRDGCAAGCSEMESERLASINLANRYRHRSESMDQTSRSCEPPEAAERQERRSHTVGYNANFEQELRDACQAVFPNSPRSQAASRRASTVSGQQGEGLRSFGSLAIPRAHEARRASNALSVASAGAPDVERKHSLQLPGPESPSNRRPSAGDSPRLGNRKLSNVSGSLQLPDSNQVDRRLSNSSRMQLPDSQIDRRLSNSSRRLSNSLAWSPLPSQGSSYNNGTRSGSYVGEGDGSSNANWVQHGSKRSCSLSSQPGSNASGRKRPGAGTDHFRFTSVGTRLRESFLKKITGRGDKSKRTSTTGALSRLKKWGLPKYVQQMFVDYAERTQAMNYRQVLGVKCVDELAAEVEAGLCRIVAGEQVTRVVQVCALRILAPTGEGGIKQDLVLVQKWHHSRKGGWFRKNALPSTKLRGQEEPREAAKRMLEDEFGEFTEFLKLQDDVPLEELVQEKESTSYPGLLTRYMTTIVEVRIRPEVDMKALADMGLGPDCPDHLQGSILTESEAGETNYDWMQTKHCRVMGIPVAGVKDYMTLEVLREQEDQDSDDGNALETRPDPVELVRVLREATDADPCVSLKDMVRERGEILELSLEEIAKGFYREQLGGGDNMTSAERATPRTPSSSSRFQTCPCTPSGTLLSDDTNDAPLSCVAPLPIEGALPKRGSLFQILAMMQHMQAHADEPQNLDERRRSWGEKSHALSTAMSENSVSTAMLWKMAMQDWDFDRQTVSGTGSKRSSPPPALDMLEHGASMSRVPTHSEALFRDLCHQLESVDLQKTDSSKDKRKEKFNSRGSGRNYAEKFNSVTPPELEPQRSTDEVTQDASSANAAASASKECLATNCSAQVSTATGSRESAETPDSTSGRADVPDSDSHEEKVRRYSERKAKRKASKEAVAPADGEDTVQASSSVCQSNAHDSNANETSTCSSLPAAEESDPEEKARKYEARKARLKAKKANAKPGQVNYGEILRNAYEQFPNAAAPDASSPAQAEQGGASSSSTAPSPSESPACTFANLPVLNAGSTDAPDKDDGVKHTTSGGSLESETSGPESPRSNHRNETSGPESPRSQKSDPADGSIGPEGLWEVVRNLVAAGESPSPEPDEKPKTQEEKMKQWRERKERRKSSEKSKKRPSYGTLLKKESSPRSTPSPTHESDDASSDLPQKMTINVVGTALSNGPCSASTSLFGGRQSAGSQNLGFEFSAGLVQANGRLSLPKTLLAPIPSPPGSRRASELERDEEDEEDDGTRRSLVAGCLVEDACLSEPLSSPDSCFGAQEEEDAEEQVDGQGAEEVGNHISLTISEHVAHMADDHGDEEADEDLPAGPPCEQSSSAELCLPVSQRCEQPSGGEPASLRYSREQRSTDTLEQAMDGLGM